MKIATANPDKFHAPVDVRKWLPADRVMERIPHDKDADFLPCQLGLLYLSAFVECVGEVAQHMAAYVDDAKVWVLYCSAGQHSSDGVAKALASRVFNAAVDGQRYFNCNVFSLSCANVDSIEARVVAEALKWVRIPWVVFEAPLWAAGAHIASNVARLSLAKIDDIGRDILEKYGSKFVDGEVERSGGDRRDAARGSGDAEARPSKHSRVDDATDEPGPEPVPKIDTIEVWSAILEKLGVDRKARVDWCSLYASNKEEAVSIVHKMLKKSASGGFDVDNMMSVVQKMFT